MAGYQSLITSGVQNPFTWSQGIKREIASYGATMERKITGIDWATECLKRIQLKNPKELGRMYLMIEDDMSFMEPIFMEKQLPFPEYIVKSGYHPMTQEVINKTCALEADKDAESTKVGALRGMMDKYGLHFAAQYKIPCAGGAEFSISVISGKMFYSRTDAPYEIMGVALEDGEESGEPMPYQTDEQLMIYLAKVVAKAQEY